MSNQALDLLVDAGFITSSGELLDLEKLTESDVSEMLSQYSIARKQVAQSEVGAIGINDKLNALFSTSSTDVSRDNLLASALVYESIIVDDPLVSSTSISMDTLEKGLNFFSWAFKLIRAGFIKVLPLSYFNRPSDDIPLLMSDDAFKSAIPSQIHDFIHEQAILNSVKLDDSKGMLVLNEKAELKRRSALNVSFQNDYWHSGVSLYLFKTIEVVKQEGDHMVCRQFWDKDQTLDEEKFKHWAYQSINQAMRARLANIYNESHLAAITGHTYITESPYEAKLLSMTGVEGAEQNTAVKFLDANDSFISIESPESLLELKTKYASAFDRFNYSIQSISGELSGISASEFDRKAKQLFHKEILPQIDEIRDGAKSISASGTKGALINLAGLSIGVYSGSVLPLVPFLLYGVSGALTEVLPEVSKQQRFKNKPAYIWHRISRKY